MSRLTLIRWRYHARANRLRALAQRGWRLLPIGVAAIILLIYATLWLQSLIHQLAGTSTEPSQRTTITNLACLALGLVAGSIATAQDRAALTTSFLAIQPWPDHARRDAILLSLLSRLATGTALIALALRLGAPSAGIAERCLPLATALFSAGFIAGCALNAVTQSRPRSARQPAPQATIWLAPLDHAAPRWAGWWTLASRRRRIAVLSAGSLAASLPIAEAAAHGAHPVMLAPVIATLGPLLMLIGATSCTPLLSPVLRTSPTPYHRAATAMFRLPASLAAAWFALFAIAGLSLDLIRPRPLAGAGAAALLLGLGYALAALSIPGSAGLALGFYLTALMLAADQYAALQNLAFLILYALLIILMLRARAAFRAGR
ncbi:MAG: hypothetical protein B7Z58_07160 [Acidiphilium sp. 37-64-53]|uniref:hypothetical protein n=1 Tax=Acidiphilium TaxID=522 RepID=UPI000BD894F2|nr:MULTISPECIES: hypothetical protein [Acidiphilium]OYW02634.1 MAG: hypothetical protein B7Z58_07160 [Acidiphilium sp. 37-64-53]OZB29922.1 MAG: hypothetical protein B7X49_05405 [Acidiphilium sp. 34-64-41]HQT83977.1 hypothetical protein [Acidiphilium rubrum]